MSDFAPKGSSNVPDWKQDGNNPFTANGENSLSGTLADTGFDEYLMRVVVTGEAGVTGDWELTTNGETSAYGHVDQSGTRTTGDSDYLITAGVDGRSAVIGSVLFTARGNRRAEVFDLAHGVAQSDLISRGRTGTNQTDLSSFTLDHPASNDVTGTAEVYHRNIE